MERLGGGKKKERKYLDPVRELKKLCNMKVTVVPVTFGTLGIVSKIPGKEWRN